MTERGDLLVPTLGGSPWLEKPPLAPWLISIASLIAGGVTPTAARLPSALAAFGLVLAVTSLGTRHFGRSVGLLAGAIQGTTVWTVLRGRLAEADILLVCLTTWSIVAFDRMREKSTDQRNWRWLFFALLGSTALAKGIGFGGALVTVVITLWLLSNRDQGDLRALLYPRGWLLTAVLAFAWPVVILVQHPSAIRLWFLHVADRFAGHPHEFAGESWWAYSISLLWQTAPWTPLALRGAWESLKKALSPAGQSSVHRLLWVWSVGPALLVSLASVRNAHYLIYALPPWSIWAALRLSDIGGSLQRRGFYPQRIRSLTYVGFALLGTLYGVGYTVLGPQFDRRGREWAFYETAGREIRAGEDIVLLYDDWDRKPYANLANPVPHDFAVRLYYLNRPAHWCDDVAQIARKVQSSDMYTCVIIARERDLPGLQELGQVQILARGPTERPDRSFILLRLSPDRKAVVAGQNAIRLGR